MSSTSFAVDLQDIHFVLFDQLEMQRKLGQHGRYAELDRDVYEATLAEAKRLAEEVLGPINKTGDRVGCKLDGDGNVTTPPGYKEAWKIMAEGGWVAVSAPSELGGGGMPFTMAMIVNEILCGASMAFMMYPGLTAGAARVILSTRRSGCGCPSRATCSAASGAGRCVSPRRARAARSATTAARRRRPTTPRSTCSRVRRSSSAAATRTSPRTSATWCSRARPTRAAGPRGSACSWSPST
ncbi:MAG: acyl-CoA dehydrogenase family protein [Nannocystis sp.]|nr:acyl-CoA dehydrogenase family protein [Nannocystis sp.]